MNKRVSRRLILAAPFIGAAAWGGDRASAAAPNVVTWANNGEVSTMDPHGAFSTANAALLGNIYETLVRLDRNLQFEPCLATKWEVIAPDRYRFTIRRNVRFHDGAMLTPADVVASIHRAAVPNSPYASVTHMIKDVTETGDGEVDVLLRGPYPLLINDLAGVSILSESWMKQHDSLQPADPVHGRDEYTSLHANGTGPFRLISRQPDSETVLERFPDWWDRPAHNIDRIVYRPIPNDATRAAAFLGGQLDLITPLPLQDLDRARRTPGVQPVEGQDLRVTFLGFNVAPDHVPVGGEKNPLTDRRVRLALASAVDIEAITRTVMRGLTNPIDSLVAPEVHGYDPSQAVKRASFDPAKAKALLAEAGYPEGFAIGLDCPNDRFVNADRVCAAVASMWARIGVKVTLSAMRYPAYMQKFLNRRSDIYMLGWANTPQLDASSILNNVFHTRDQRNGSWNAGGYSDPAFDDLVKRSAQEMDATKRQQLLDKAFAMEREAVWTIPLYREPLVLGVKRGFSIPASPDGRMRFWLARME